MKDVKDAGDSVSVTFEPAGTAQTATADVCLVAIGRGPVTDGLELEDDGVETDRGYVKVDGQLQTTVPHVWALGDVAATPLQLAHVSFTEGYAVAERIAGETVPEIEYAGIPQGHVLLSRDLLGRADRGPGHGRGHAVEIEKLNFQGVGKANIVGEGGLVKLVAEKGGSRPRRAHGRPARDGSRRRGDAPLTGRRSPPRSPR